MQTKLDSSSSQAADSNEEGDLVQALQELSNVQIGEKASRTRFRNPIVWMDLEMTGVLEGSTLRPHASADASCLLFHKP